MSLAKEMDEAIGKHFEIPPEIQRLASQAAWDLHYGPQGVGLDDEGEYDYPGFSAACAEVSEWCADNLSEVWYDIQSGEVLDREPQGYWVDSLDGELDEDSGEPIMDWNEPSWEDYYHCPLSDVKCALFNKELVQYI